MPSRDDARAVVARMVDGFNRKDADALAELYVGDIELWSSLGAEARGRDEVLGHMRELFARLPDEQMSGDVLITDGHTVVVEFISRGSTPTGMAYEIRFTDVLELSDGRIRSIRTYVDPYDVARAEEAR
jgi:uncharacterized protein (TIGR02246 family)